MTGIDRTELRNHLAGRHGAVTAADSPLEELIDLHLHEHNGPCGIRNHPIDDLTYDPTRAETVFAEAAAEADTEGTEWIQRAAAATAELVALATAAGTETFENPMNLSVRADPADADLHPDVTRRYFVDADELTHGPEGAVTGVRRVRWELHLTRIGPLEGDPR